MAGDLQQATVAGLQTLATTYQQRATDCQDVANFLSRQNSNLYWQSEAATSFKNSMSDYMTVLNRLHQQFTNLSNELKNRAQILEETQRNPALGRF
jgi:uncharacterized protein YukE